MSVVVRVSPPKHLLVVGSLFPTEVGPTETLPSSFRRTWEPPPRPILRTSGILKAVRTPPISTVAGESRGNPEGDSAAKSEVVPPMSICTD